VYATFLLGIYAGLRVGEIRFAHRTWLKELYGQWHLVVPFTAAKSKRDRIVAIPNDVAQELIAGMDKDGYLVPAMSVSHRRRICEMRHSGWMRSLGFDGGKTTHELRKIYGATIATRDGIFAAQKALGHSNPMTTYRYYSALMKGVPPVSRELWLSQTEKRVAIPVESATVQPQIQSDNLNHNSYVQQST
jgi:integrase